MESSAQSIIRRAVDMDKRKNYTLALVLYQEGLQILINSLRTIENRDRRQCLTEKTQEYMKRAEDIKKLIDEGKTQGNYREQIKIEAGSIGYSYNSVFGRFLDDSVTNINIQDPYIRLHHQCLNLVRFCELAVQKCPLLLQVSLITTQDPDDHNGQLRRLCELKQSLQSRSIVFEMTFSETLHDRQIYFSNGWVIKIGRGLDYFKAAGNKFVLGACDLDLRPCLETTIDIFHRSELRISGTR